MNFFSFSLSTLEKYRNGKNVQINVVKHQKTKLFYSKTFFLRDHGGSEKLKKMDLSFPKMGTSTVQIFGNFWDIRILTWNYHDNPISKIFKTRAILASVLGEEGFMFFGFHAFNSRKIQKRKKIFKWMLYSTEKQIFFVRNFFFYVAMKRSCGSKYLCR